MSPRIVLTRHAWRQLRRRHIPENVVLNVATRPEQAIRVGHAREIRQSIVTIGSRAYLVRVVLDVARHDISLVTAYRSRGHGV